MAWNRYLWVKNLNLVEAEVMRNKFQFHILSLRIKTMEFSFPFRSFFISIFCLRFFYPLDLDKVTLACFKTSQFSVCVSSLPSDNQLVAGKNKQDSHSLRIQQCPNSLQNDELEHLILFGGASNLASCLGNPQCRLLTKDLIILIIFLVEKLRHWQIQMCCKDVGS